MARDASGAGTLNTGTFPDVKLPLRGRIKEMAHPAFVWVGKG